MAIRKTQRERRQIILDAAAANFAASGYHAASMREIAAAAGVTKPVLYDHFASKRQLYVALIESARDELFAGTAAAMRRDAPVAERIRQAIDDLFAYVEASPDAARVLFTMPEGEPTIVAAARRVQDEATARLVALLVAEPGLSPVGQDGAPRFELYMEFFKDGLQGLARWWAEHPETPRQSLVDAAMGLAWQGLSAHFARRDG